LLLLLGVTLVLLAVAAAVEEEGGADEEGDYGDDANDDPRCGASVYAALLLLFGEFELLVAGCPYVYGLAGGREC